jgi:hypothetical protein
MRTATQHRRLAAAFIAVGMIALALLPSCRTAERAPSPVARSAEEAPPQRTPQRWLENEGPRLTADELARVTVPVPRAWSAETDVYAVFAGQVHRYSDDAAARNSLGRFVVLAHETSFSIGETTETSRFFTMYADLGEVAVRPRQRVAAGDAIASARADGETGVRIGVYTTADDPVWRRQTGRPPIVVDGYYFWDPSFVLSPP